MSWVQGRVLALTTVVNPCCSLSSSWVVAIVNFKFSVPAVCLLTAVSRFYRKSYLFEFLPSWVTVSGFPWALSEIPYYSIAASPHVGFTVWSTSLRPHSKRSHFSVTRGGGRTEGWSDSTVNCWIESGIQIPLLGVDSETQLLPSEGENAASSRNTVQNTRGLGFH